MSFYGMLWLNNWYNYHYDDTIKQVTGDAGNY